MSQVDFNEIIKAANEGKTVKILKCTGNKDYYNDYMREYTKRNFYNCLVCNCNVTVTHFKKHMNSEKHKRNLYSSPTPPEKVYSLIKNGIKTV